MSELNYEKDVTINEDALDVDWLEQPRLMIRYSRYAAECRYEYEQAKTNVDVVKAELDKQVRNNPSEFGIEKPTEGAINSAIQASEKFQEAQKALHQAQYDLNVAQAAVKSIDGKKDALENLVRLHGQQYFAGPKVPRDLSKEWEQREKQIKSNSKVKISRKK